MNQKELSFLYRGVVLFIAGAGTIAVLSKAHETWAKDAGAIGGVLLFIAFAVFMAFVAFKQFRTFTAPVGDEPIPEDLYLDGWCLLARLAVAASVLLLVVVVATLFLVEPPKQCPNWQLPSQRPIPWWFLFLWTGLLHAGLIFLVVRWRWAIRKAIESVNYPITMPVSYMLVPTAFFGCGMAQLPWIAIFHDCFF